MVHKQTTSCSSKLCCLPEIIWWMVYADGEHIKCSMYSLLPPLSHPPLPALRPPGATQKAEGRQMKLSFLQWCLTFGVWLLHFEVNPSSSCQGEWTFMSWRYLHTLLYGGCKENPTCEQVRMERISLWASCWVSCLIRCVALGLFLHMVLDTRGDRRWQSMAQVTRCKGAGQYTWTHFTYEDVSFDCLSEERVTLEHEGQWHTFVPVIRCLCLCVRLCVYTANRGLIW